MLRTLVNFFILVAFRLSGKREVGQLAPFDFALVLLIANSVQNAMVGANSSLLGGLVAAAVLLAANFVLWARSRRAAARWSELLRGQARILVNRGEPGRRGRNSREDAPLLHGLQERVRSEGPRFRCGR